MLDPDILKALEDSLEPFDSLLPRAVMLFYGDNGTGKTLAAFQIAQQITPPDKDIIYFDTSEGWVTLLAYPSLKKRAHRIAFKGITHLKLVADAIAAKAGRFANVGCIILDESSSFAADNLVAIGKIREQRIANDPKKENPLATGAFDRADYNVSMNFVMDAYNHVLRNAQGVHIFSLAHERDNSKENAPVNMTPDFPLALCKKMMREQQVTARFQRILTKEPDGSTSYSRVVQVNPLIGSAAKNRLDIQDVYVTPEVLVQRTVDYLKGNVAVRELEVQEEITQEEIFEGIKV